MSQPELKPNQHPASWDLVIQRVADKRDQRADGHPDRDLSDYDGLLARMRQRDEIGRQQYGTPLQPFNGRDSIEDAMDEILDLCVYLENAHAENPVPTLRMMADEAAYFALRLQRWINHGRHSHLL